MVRLADAFELAFPEQDRVTLMRDAMVGDRRSDCEALGKAALAQGLIPKLLRPASLPPGCAVPWAPRLCLPRAAVNSLGHYGMMGLQYEKTAQGC